ncbi:4-hydroxy-tetrahydrodipicolinate synthase [Nocardia goodfellowii]|uniref:4-hydroxy-tetrahydrodipicolinate synthase n=1 Tax=Nocardia goodfellowii TaxID=882446 RepID=A0ABS4QPI0_9NOCA|nr:4-hydroxy-tetrahydrodipicolinate synthase [Nocardia goodfellowii]MBP2192924.1 4-hydroxy-tetrahydrodipicolinate synthase [Nocardia goodfellowii]
MTFTGLFVPLVTPFTAGDDIATDALEGLAHSALDGGATGLVALGTTAEAATLTTAEQQLVLEICARVCLERDAALIVGAGSNSTAASADSLAALRAPVAAALTVVPYYTRPSEAGVLAHFRRLAATSPVPLIVYNVPHRTGRTLGANTLHELARIPNIAGFKHAIGGIDDATVTFMSTLPPAVDVLAGDDLHAAALLALGASGGILASANVAPTAYTRLISAWRTGTVAEARAHAHRLAALSAALFAEPNPTVIKAVLAARGRIPTPAVRLPLLPAAESTTAAALDALDRCDDFVPLAASFR